MNISFNFKNFEPSENLSDYARKRFNKLTKYKTMSGVQELFVTLGVEKNRQMVDVIFTSDNLTVSAHENTEDMYASIDLVLDKVEAQIRKLREKEKDRRKGARSSTHRILSFENTESGTLRTPVIVESDEFQPKPMPVEEAAEQLDQLSLEFLVFINSETEKVNVMYRRKDGDFGLIDPGIA